MVDFERWVDEKWNEFPRTSRRIEFELVLREAYQQGQADAAAETAELRRQIDDLQEKLTRVREEVGSSVRAAFLLIEDKQ